jgi:hypothetical protein
MSAQEIFKKICKLNVEYKPPAFTPEKVMNFSWEGHRYGAADVPVPINSPVSIVKELEGEKVLGFCFNCNEQQPLAWRKKHLRGKKCQEWFVCSNCGSSNIEINYLK